ncbi:MAG: RnfABCDGE type electron transport complex subunit D [Spirochaetia bacterium]
MNERVRITSSPQYHDRESTARIMWTVSACLVPAAAWGVYVFGLRALWVVMASITAAVASEYLAGLPLKRFTLADGSAVLTGLLVGMNMPPAVPFYIPVIASVFAIVVVKWTFGGLGSNWMNPALAGRVFVFFSWTRHMTKWTMPTTLPVLDGFSSATYLGIVKTGLTESNGATGGPLALLERVGFPHSNLDTIVTDWLNTVIFDPLRISLPFGYVDPFVGNIPGSIGEISALLLLLGSVYLFARRIITWEIPTTYFLSFGLLTWIFGGLVHGGRAFTGDVLFHVLSGGFMLAVFFMATDMATSPMTRKGMLIYGAGVGFLTFLIRTYGSFPEGASLAIILMNIFVPLIDRTTRPSRFGVRKAQEAEL